MSAAETKSPPDPKTLAPSTLSGKVIAVDKTIRSLTVEIQGKPLQVNVTRGMKITRRGKVTSFDEVVVGQQVSLTFAEIQGKLEVVLVAIDGNPAPAEAAGKGGVKGSSGPPETHPGNLPTPFPGNANPANNNGITRSKNK